MHLLIFVVIHQKPVNHNRMASPGVYILLSLLKAYIFITYLKEDYTVNLYQNRTIHEIDDNG